jgi:hypothetical protein
VDWLVHARSEIQKVSLEIYNFDLALARHPDKRAKVWPIQGFLIGIAFSLWRSVFLSLPKRSPVEMYESGQLIIKIILETNTVGFSQDIATQQWMAGFYNNNAILRLFSIFENAESIALLESTRKVDVALEAMKYHPSEQRRIAALSPKDQYAFALEGLKLVLALVKGLYPELSEAGSDRA